MEVNAADLIGALRAMNAAQRAGRDVRLSCKSGEMEFVRAKTAVRFPATGTWARTAVLHVSALKGLLQRAKALPASFVLEGTEHMLHFSHYAVPCRWETARGESEE